MGKSTMPLIAQKLSDKSVRIVDTENYSWTEWDMSAWRVRRTREYDPAA